MLLPETQDALLEYQASQEYMTGAHEANEPRVGILGRNIGEVPYDPIKHGHIMPNPLSIMEQVLDIPHVDLVIPKRPLQLNVLIHQPDYKGYDRSLNWGAHRRILGRQVANSVIDSVPGLTDRVNTYVIGKAADEIDDPEVETILTEGDPQAEAELVASICVSGLSIVISDFLKLPLQDQSKLSFPATVAIKANIEHDLKVPSGGAVLRTGHKAGEVDIAKNNEIERSNRLLLSQHQRVIRNLGSQGIAVTTVLSDSRYANSFNNQDLDHQLATAITSITPA